MYSRSVFSLAFTIITLCIDQSAGLEAQPQEKLEDPAGVPADKPDLQQDMDGQLEEKEYRCISSNCAVTRAVCPHTCEDRGLAPENCQTWRSRSNEQECYVKDTRYDTDVMPDSPL